MPHRHNRGITEPACLAVTPRSLNHTARRNGFRERHRSICTSLRQVYSPYTYLREATQTEATAVHLNSKNSDRWEGAFKVEACTPTFTMHINKYSLFKFCTLRFNILHPKHFANGCLLCKILYSAHCHSVQNYRYNITLPLVCFL